MMKSVDREIHRANTKPQAFFIYSYVSERILLSIEMTLKTNSFHSSVEVI